MAKAVGGNPVAVLAAVKAEMLKADLVLAALLVGTILDFKALQAVTAPVVPTTP